MGSEGSTSPSGCAVCGGMAAVYCAADAAALCVPCDAAVHAANPLASRHERVPLALAAAAAASGVYESLFAADDDAASSCCWPVPPPPQGQGQGSPNSCSSSFTNDCAAPTNLLDLLSDVELMGMSGAAPAGAPMWLHPGLAAGTPAWTSWPSSPEAVVVPTAAAADREARVRRYREKRKSRKFHKTVRYASRKAYAEARPRIKGRFVKRAAAAAGSDNDGDGAAQFWLSFSDDGGVGLRDAAYGVVPTF